MLTLPIVDLESFSSIDDLASELMRVGKNPGFFYVVGHDLGDEVAAPVFGLAGEFFASPVPEKMSFCNGSGDLGYTGLRDEKLSGAGSGDVKESFYLSDPGKGGQAMPAVLNDGQAQLAQFYAGCSQLAQKLLQAIAIGLGVDQDHLSKAHTGESCRMRLINYPSIPQSQTTSLEGEDIRAGAHSDYGSLTLLFRQPSDQGGLQVLQGESWMDVPCLPNAIVVNIGDALEFWTAGRLRSTVHRVAFPRSASENVARLSIPVFIQPDKNIVLKPIKVAAAHEMPTGTGTELSADFLDVLRRKGYTSAEPLTSHEHLNQRIRATYA